VLPPTKARVSRFAENPPPLADVLSGDMQCDFYEDREVLHVAIKWPLPRKGYVLLGNSVSVVQADWP
jgi:hypothetical protein